MSVPLFPALGPMTDNPQTTDELKRDYFSKLAWYFAERPTGFYTQLGQVKDQLITLNARLDESGKASAALTASLNRLTFWGVIVASLGVLVAAGALLLEFVKYQHGAA